MILSGELLALRALDFEKELRALLYRYVRNPADVQELLQEISARLLSLPQARVTRIRSVRPFVRKVARNVAIDWLRHRQIIPLELMADLETLERLDESPAVEEQVNAAQELELSAAALDKFIALKCGRVFYLRKVKGLTQQEISSRLQISEETVHAHLTRATRLFTHYLLNSPAGQKSSLPDRIEARAVRGKGERSK